MGWTTYRHGTQAQVIADRIKDHGHTDGSRAHCLAHKHTPGVLWTVWEKTTPSGERTRFIGCDLIEGASYKDMAECMHPYFYDCPLSFLEMVPQVACAEWRELVRAHHARIDGGQGVLAL